MEHARWAPDLDGARVIDLFAGSGAMGLEALSRGAGFGWFVERNAQAVAVIRANVASLGLADRSSVERCDATRLGARAPSAPAFDFAFVDPPYREAIAEAAMAQLTAGGWLAERGVVVLERATREASFAPAGYERLDERVWGAARVSFLRRSGR